MSIIEKGRVCVVTQGSDAGKKVVIQEVMDNNFVKIAGEDVKERRSNVKHLEPTSQKTTSTKAKKPKTKTKKVKPKKQKKSKKKPASKKTKKGKTTKKKPTKSKK